MLTFPRKGGGPFPNCIVRARVRNGAANHSQHFQFRNNGMTALISLLSQKKKKQKSMPPIKKHKLSLTPRKGQRKNKSKKNSNQSPNNNQTESPIIPISHPNLKNTEEIAQNYSRSLEFPNSTTILTSPIENSESPVRQVAPSVESAPEICTSTLCTSKMNNNNSLFVGFPHIAPSNVVQNSPNCIFNIQNTPSKLPNIAQPDIIISPQIYHSLTPKLPQLPPSHLSKSPQPENPKIVKPRGRPKKDFRTTHQFQQEISRLNIRIKELSADLKNCKSENQKLKQADRVEKIVAKEGKRYSFQMALAVVNFRKKGGIALRKCKETSKLAMKCYIQNIQMFENSPFPCKTTISRMERAIGRCARIVEKQKLQQESFLTLLFDGSTQYKNISFLAVSVNRKFLRTIETKTKIPNPDKNSNKKFLTTVVKTQELIDKECFLDLAHLSRENAAHITDVIKSVVEDFQIDWDSVWWLCGDCCPTNLGCKGGIYKLIADSDEVKQIIPWIKCSLHVINFTFNGAIDTLSKVIFSLIRL